MTEFCAKKEQTSQLKIIVFRILAFRFFFEWERVSRRVLCYFCTTVFRVCLQCTLHPFQEHPRAKHGYTSINGMIFCV